MNNIIPLIPEDETIYQVYLDTALCTDPPHQSTSCLSGLWRSPALCVVLGVVLCTIAVAAIAGIVLLGIGIFSVYCVLYFILTGLACVALLAVGTTLVYQGGLHKLPRTTEETLAYLDRRVQSFRKTIQEVDTQRTLPCREGSTAGVYLNEYQTVLEKETAILLTQYRWLASRG